MDDDGHESLESTAPRRSRSSRVLTGSVLVVLAIVIVFLSWKAIETWRLDRRIALHRQQIEEATRGADRVVIEAINRQKDWLRQRCEEAGVETPDSIEVVLVGADKVDALMRCFDFEPTWGYPCACYGNTAITVFKGEKEQLSLVEHHGNRFGWSSGAVGATDDLTAQGAECLEAWLDEKFYSVNPWFRGDWSPKMADLDATDEVAHDVP